MDGEFACLWDDTVTEISDVSTLFCFPGIAFLVGEFFHYSFPLLYVGSASLRLTFFPLLKAETPAAGTTSTASARQFSPLTYSIPATMSTLGT
jgi:hypothetical protein